MSSQPLPSQRPLTLTEELEKLEQSITLTLQEIDQNFSQAHRIVTTSILPLVEQYAEHSREVWEGAKFWKQFFEASANVSLSGYEERPNDETTQEQTMSTEGETTTTNITGSTNDTVSYDTTSEQFKGYHRREDDLDLSSLAISSHSTPRAQMHESHGPHNTSPFMLYSSPGEKFNQRFAETDLSPEPQDPHELTTPGKPFSSASGRRGRTQHVSDTPLSSLFASASRNHHSTIKGKSRQQPLGPVLHYMLDKTYRVQATPLGKDHGGRGQGRSKFTVTPKPSSRSRFAFDDSPISSPELEAPKLHTELFSPLKMRTPGTSKNLQAGRNLQITPRPDISVLTSTKRRNQHPAGTWDSDSGLDDEDHDTVLGPSPPKTMQFHIPQSRLMKTPAREASKLIVSDLLATAGAVSVTDDFEIEQSPSVIRRVEKLKDETF